VRPRDLDRLLERCLCVGGDLVRDFGDWERDLERDTDRERDLEEFLEFDCDDDRDDEYDDDDEDDRESVEILRERLLCFLLSFDGSVRVFLCKVSFSFSL
jgi:hypothetical protein